MNRGVLDCNINTPEVPPASFVPQVKNPLRLNSRVVGVSGTFRQTPSSSLTPSIPAAPIPIPVIPPIPATSLILLIIPVTAETPVRPTTSAKSKPKPCLVKSKTPAVPIAPNMPNKAKAMRIQKTINAWNICAATWKATGNLLGTAKQFKGYWEQLPAAEKAVFEAQAQTLLAVRITNRLTLEIAVSMLTLTTISTLPASVSMDLTSILSLILRRY
ncbi:hypothetical protein F4604DRAFT_1921273 [Suillus subluteus]|nr:hypothetical protein F4604DRAFT_1921273 [Suillus subluteus]